MLESLKRDFLGNEYTLIDFDNEVLENLYSTSIFDGDYMAVLYDLNVVYITDYVRDSGYQFFFEISENDLDFPSNIVIKVTDIQKW